MKRKIENIAPSSKRTCITQNSSLQIAVAGVKDDVIAALAAGVMTRELVGGTEFYKCLVCESALRMCGSATAASHLLGQRHRKNKARANTPPSAPAVATCNTSSSPAVGSDAHARALREGVLSQVAAGAYLCCVCKIIVAGIRPAEQHLIGGPHVQLLIKWRKDRQLALNGTNSVGSSNGSSSHLVSKVKAANATAHDASSSLRTAADNSSSGHSSSSSRARAGEVTPQDKNVTAALAAGVMARELVGANEFYKCNVCESASSMCGSATAASHLLGQRHRKTIARENTPSSAPAAVTCNTSSSLVGNDARARALREGVLCQVAEDAFQCCVCKITVVGIRSAEQHLIGGPHIQLLIKWRENRQLALNGTNSVGSSTGSSSHLVSKVGADNATIHDASSSLGSAADNSSSGHSSSSSCARPEEVTSPDSQFKIIRIGLNDVVDWDI